MKISTRWAPALLLGLVGISAGVFGLGERVDAAERFHDAPASATKRKNPISAKDTTAIEAGGKLFATNCASCHGKDAMGTGNVPALARGAVQSTPDGEVFWFIGHGSLENGMPPSKLPERDRWKIVAFIKSLAGQPANSASSVSANSGAAANASDASAADGAAAKSKFPPPQAPFTDYRFEAPGKMHKILAKDLPAPAPETTVGNAPDVVSRPTNAWPKVPTGFHVQLFAEALKNPRLLRTAPNGDIFLAESEPGRIRVFRGMTAEGKPERTEIFATDLNEPYGIAFYPPGNSPQWIYVGNTNSVVRFPYKPGDLKASAAAQKIVDLPHSMRGHWTRDLQFSPDGAKLYVAVGSASNVDDPDKVESEKNRADILVMKPDGSDGHVFASGIRNAGGGILVDSSNGDLWASVNERDGLGDNLVPDYISRVREGDFFGWPWWYIGGNQDPRHPGTHPELKAKLKTPEILLQPHHASLEMALYEAKMFPAEYAGDLFAAQHGSWNRSVRTGYELIRVPLHQKGQPTGDYEDFMTGFVVDDGHVWGRPVGVTVAPDGSLLVSDDGSNSVWRVTYDGK